MRYPKTLHGLNKQSMNSFNSHYDLLERKKRSEAITILVIRPCAVYSDKDEGGGGMRNDDVLKKKKTAS